MANSNPFTNAVRTLLDKHNGDITYGDARPLMVQMGVPVVSQPKPAVERSNEYRKWAKTAFDVPFPKNAKPDAQAEWYADSLKRAGLPPTSLQAIMREHKPIRMFKLEENRFNAAKAIWRQQTGTKASGKSMKAAKGKGKKGAGRKKSVQPTPVRTQAPVARTKAAPVPTTVFGTDFEAVQFVIDNGGVDAVKARLAEIEVEQTKLVEALDRASAVMKKVAA